MLQSFSGKKMDIKVGDLIVGTVSGVRPYALFISFENGQSGLLHISELSDSYIRDIEKYATIGDKIKVKVLDVDSNNGFLRLSYKQVPTEEMFNTHNDSIRRIPKVDFEDFKPLEEHLPIWIKETLKKAQGNNDD